MFVFFSSKLSDIFKPWIVCPIHSTILLPLFAGEGVAIPPLNLFAPKPQVIVVVFATSARDYIPIINYKDTSETDFGWRNIESMMFFNWKALSNNGKNVDVLREI